MRQRTDSIRQQKQDIHRWRGKGDIVSVTYPIERYMALPHRRPLCQAPLKVRYTVVNYTLSVFFYMPAQYSDLAQRSTVGKSHVSLDRIRHRNRYCTHRASK